MPLLNLLGLDGHDLEVVLALNLALSNENVKQFSRNNFNYHFDAKVPFKKEVCLIAPR